MYVLYMCNLSCFDLVNSDILSNSSILAYALLTRCFVFLFHLRSFESIVPKSVNYLTVSIVFPLRASLVENWCFFVKHHEFCFVFIQFNFFYWWSISVFHQGIVVILSVVEEYSYYLLKYHLEFETSGCVMPFLL